MHTHDSCVGSGAYPRIWVTYLCFLFTIILALVSTEGSAAGPGEHAQSETREARAQTRPASLEDALIEIQEQIPKLEMGPPMSYDLDGSTSFKFLNDKGHLFVETSGNSRFDLGEGDRQHKGQFAIDPLTRRIAVVRTTYGPGQLVIVDVPSGKVLECQPKLKGQWSQVLKIGDHFFVASLEGENEPTLEIQRFEVKGGRCIGREQSRQKLLGKQGRAMAMTRTPSGMRVLAEGENPPGTGSNTVDVFELTEDGTIRGHRLLDGYALKVDWENHPVLSSSDQGTLVALSDDSDLTGATDLYLLNEKDRPRMLSPHTKYGVWTTPKQVLAATSVNAGDTELVLLDEVGAHGANVKTKLKQPVGEKIEHYVHNGKIRYANSARSVGIEQYESDLNASATPISIDDSLSLKKLLKKAQLPVSKTVTYQSGGRRVASMLSVPAGCDAEHKRPAVVYLHGGNWTGHPTGNSALDHRDDDYLMLAQLGYVILEANYWGNRYEGPGLDRGGKRYAQLEGYDRQLEDIHSAAAYLKSVPCADPNRLFLFGHSFGAILGSVYVTSKEYRTKNPFKGTILRGGAYQTNDMNEAVSPRLAIRNTEEDRRIDVGPWLQDNGLSVFTPTKKIFRVQEALGELARLEKEGKKYYAVVYEHPESYYERILSTRRAKDVHPIPIYLMADAGDTAETKALESSLRGVSAAVTAWYPPGEEHHYFTGEAQREMIHRVQTFVNQNSKSK